MIQMYSMLEVADNSGAKKAMCIKVLGGSKRKYARIGDYIIVTVKEAIPNSNVKKGTVHRAIIIRTKKTIKRKDGSVLRFDDNACVMLKKDGEPNFNRVFGPVARELRARNITKILSLAPEVL